jgi:hypothetical protein
MVEGRGERATGTPNTIYDLSSVLFHALEGGASYDQYIQDAEEAGDEELADFFRRVRDEDSMRADEAQMLIAERTPSTVARTGGSAVSAEGVAAGAPPGTEPAGVAPGTEPIEEEVPPPRTEPGIATPRTEETLPRTEEAPPPPTEERPLGTQTPPPEERERARREADKGLIDRAKDAILGKRKRGEEKEPTVRAGDKANGGQ